MITDADRLAAAGAPLTIAGHSFHVKYTARSLKALEDEYGSIKEVGEQLSALGQGDGKMFGIFYRVLALGLHHERVDGVAVDEDWLLDNADSRETFAYAEVAFSALSEALPGVPEGATEDPTTPAKPANPNGSTGKRASGSRSVTTTAVQTSSGTA